MPKRIERVFDYIRQKSLDSTLSDLKDHAGIEAQEIADALEMFRSNVSKELNDLHRRGQIIKIMGRPVKYFERQALESLLGRKLPPGAAQFVSWEECIGKKDTLSPFRQLIGAEGSLKTQVEQAKAAILYPPDGLHTLIVGQTGVGKTLFAHLMFEYGKIMQRFNADSPFITFNCADYYNNPQLLISQIFGHVKGAFTGADSAKSGLVEAADGGVLFLDEIHRLPPEGQEMIFYFMDTGTFSRLGETTRGRKAKVLIIGATTEDPDSALTRTFVRRIPNIITIRPLAERTLEEKLEIIRRLFVEEAQRVKKPIRIGVESIKALIGSIGAGNVGQLKSNIKLLCAQAFLNSIDNPDFIEVEFRMLPPQVKNGLITLSADRRVLAELAKRLTDPVQISPEGGSMATEEGENDDFSLYRVVEDKVALLQDEGISDELIKEILAADVNVYVRSLYNEKNAVNLTTRERLLKIVDASILDFAEEMALFVQKKLNRSFRDRFLYAFSLHLSAFLKRVKAKEVIPYPELNSGAEENSPYYQVALEIRNRITARYRVKVPDMEVAYIALLVESSEDETIDEHPIIIVATHGRSTASSMVEVAQRLFSLSDTNLIALDMPLEMKPQEILDRMTAMLRGMHTAQGVLLLADMGSLCNMGALLAEKLHIEVRTLDMVSTPLILEALRKTDITGMDLDSIYESLRSFRGYDSVADGEPPTTQREAVVTICSTGQGAALKLKTLVEEILHHTGRSVEVIPIGLTAMEDKIRELMENYRVLAAVGMKKPRLNIPFIPLEELVGGAGEKILTELVFNHEISLMPKDKHNKVVEQLCADSLERFLTYLNPAKIMGALFEFDRRLQEKLGYVLSNPIRIRLLVHCGCALERVVTRTQLSYLGEKDKIDQKKLAAIREAAKALEAPFKLSFAEDEFCYMAHML
ncbi:MAG: sigma 54-interacting transcriptional regulator [Selenomonadaceae bacterium]|nr:sigma 54-interacting transcriptional regulator [Selenomonadaceae bacterium]